ncbi:hypothetical protein BDB00DRAFT_866951 [Zychaea mexicana]|uniref:uncharacterized protein n=1 Tax=Zychaea mexicana TaxID=64656 RepID=UPI0022FE3C9A|nr:uncharacterized protein BDB00DRAFT_866951 [Zychaea mexicana]KAI9498883.1 hypothetical protein BDB00DRAFT_866951 [Zychaea mexicana]
MSARRPSHQQQRRRRSRQTAQNPGSDIPASDSENAQLHDTGHTDNDSLVSSIPSYQSNHARRQRRRSAHSRRESRAEPQQQQPSVRPPPVDSLNQSIEEVGDTAGQLANTAADIDKPRVPPSDYDDALKLRLDLNLDAEITLKAKLHGDVTLSLL